VIIYRDDNKMSSAIVVSGELLVLLGADLFLDFMAPIVLISYAVH